MISNTVQQSVLEYPATTYSNTTAFRFTGTNYLIANNWKGADYPAGSAAFSVSWWIYFYNFETVIGTIFTMVRQSGSNVNQGQTWVDLTKYPNTANWIHFSITHRRGSNHHLQRAWILQADTQGGFEDDILINKWNHFCITSATNPVDDNKLSIYWNSNLVQYNNSGWYQYNSTGDHLVIGRRHYASSTSNAYALNHAALDEFAIWDGTQLSEAQVVAVYNKGVPHDLSAFAVAPTAYYRMGEDRAADGNQWTIPDKMGDSSKNLTTVNAIADNFVSGVGNK